MLATLIQVRREIKVDPDTKVDAALDNYLLQALAHVTGRIQQIKEQEYEPRRDAKRFDAYGYQISPDGLCLYLFNDPLLEVASIIDGMTTALTAYSRSTLAGDYYLAGNRTPYYEITLAESSSARWDNFTGEWRDAIEVTGIWGYRKRYADAWVSANDTVQNNPLTSGGTTITVTDADGVDIAGVTPRFSVGQLLRIESEYVAVTGVDTTSNVLTVTRGARGTTAAAHVQGSAISLFVPEPAVNRAAIRWAAYLYFRKGAFETVKVEGDLRTTFPPDAPEEVQAILDELTDNEIWMGV